MKKIIVTGASRGIGAAICSTLIQQNQHVIGIARNHSMSATSSFTPIHYDLSDLDTLPDFLKRLQEQYQDIEGIICNAGKGRFGSLEEFAYDEIKELMELNFLSHAYLVKAFLPSMKRRGSGQIIFIGSEAALAGKKRGSIYCASKFALRGFCQALREECATQNIGVSMINPGMVQTSFFEALAFRPGDQPGEQLHPQDVADAVSLILNSRNGAVFDEINLSPQTKRILKNAK